MTRHLPARRSRHVWAWLALLLLCVFAASTRPAAAQASKTIDINATIRVTVAGEADITGDYVVDPSGDISMLYVNQVHVAGLTVAQAAARLASKDVLGKYYVHPQVVVTILQPGGITITVSGDVTGQKDYTVRSDAHLSQVLPVAEPQPDADLGRVQITHGRPGDPNRIQQTVNYLAFRDNNDPTGNPVLQDGDVVYVPSKNPVPIQVTFSGDFTKLGPQSIPAGTTLYDAIQLQGGLTATIDPKSLAIQRAGTTDRLPVDYYAAREHPNDPLINPVLKDGDTVLSSSSGLPGGGTGYTLTGAVGRPGPYALTTPTTTLSEALGLAGGVTPNARTNQVTIVRTYGNPPGQPKTLHVNAKDASIQGTTQIYPGDNITIPQGSPGVRYDPLAMLGAAGTVATIVVLMGGHL